MYSMLLSTLLATTALAGSSPARLFARTTVEVPCSYDGMVECGSVCIEPDYTCCTVGVGGCAPGTYCTDDGCCPNGEICTGPGGTDINTKTFTFTDTQTNTLTNTISVTSPGPEPTTSKPVIPTTTEATASSSVAVPSTEVPAPSTSAPESPVFTGAAANLLPGVGGVLAGVVGAVLL